MKQNTFFMPRAELTTLLEQQIKEQRFAVLTGMSGSGKTALAIDYCKRNARPQIKPLIANILYNTRNSTEAASIRNEAEYYNACFWVDCNEDDVLSELAKLLKVNNDSIEIQEALKKQAPWLIVFDNVESEEQVKKIIADEHYLKIMSLGDIICTTRLNDNKLWKHQLIQVGFYRESESIAYLTQMLQDKAIDGVKANNTINNILNPDHDFIEEARKLHRITKGYPELLASIVTQIKDKGITLADFNENKMIDAINLPVTLQDSILNLSTNARNLLDHCAFLNSECLQRDVIIKVGLGQEKYFSELINKSIISTIEYDIGNIFFINPFLQILVRESQSDSYNNDILKRLVEDFAKRYKYIAHTTNALKPQEDRFIWALHVEELLKHKTIINNVIDDAAFVRDGLYLLIRQILNYSYYEKFEISKAKYYLGLMDQLIAIAYHPPLNTLLKQIQLDHNKVVVSLIEHRRKERRDVNVLQATIDNSMLNIKNSINSLVEKWDAYCLRVNNQFTDVSDIDLLEKQVWQYIRGNYFQAKYCRDNNFTEEETVKKYVKVLNSISTLMNFNPSDSDSFAKIIRQISKLIKISNINNAQTEQFQYCLNLLTKLYKYHFVVLRLYEPAMLNRDFERYAEINNSTTKPYAKDDIFIKFITDINKIIAKLKLIKIEQQHEHVNRLLRLKFVISIKLLDRYIEQAKKKSEKKKLIEQGLIYNFNSASEFFQNCAEYPQWANKHSGRIFIDFAEQIYQILVPKGIDFESIKKQIKKSSLKQKAYSLALLMTQYGIYLYKQAYLHKTHLFYRKSEELQEYLLAIFDFTRSIDKKRFMLNPHTRVALNKTLNEVVNELEEQPNDIELRMRLARILMILNQVDDAIKQYDKILESDATYINAYLHRAHLKHFQGKHEEAIQDYQHYLYYSPDDSDTKEWLHTVQNELAAKGESRLVKLKKQKERFIYIFKETLISRITAEFDRVSGIDNRARWPDTSRRLISAASNLIPNPTVKLKGGYMGAEVEGLEIDVKAREFVKEALEIPFANVSEQLKYESNKINELKDELRDALADLAQEIADDYESFYIRKDIAEVERFAKVAAWRIGNHIASGNSNRNLPIKEQMKQGLYKGYTTNTNCQPMVSYPCGMRSIYYTSDSAHSNSNSESHSKQNKKFKYAPIMTKEGFFYKPPRTIPLPESCPEESSDKFTEEFRFGTTNEAEQLGFEARQSILGTEVIKPKKSNDEELKLDPRQYENRR